MNSNWGSFICPQCKNNIIEEKDNYSNMINYYSDSKGYQYWMNRKIFVQKEPKIEWIFYKEKNKKWNCCSCCKNRICRIFGESLICCCTDSNCNGTIFCYPCSFVFYILLCFVCDLCNFLCCGKMTYFGIKGKNSNMYLRTEVFDDGNIWEEMGGLTEEELNKRKIWLCSNCKYYNKSFTDFIRKNNINNNNINDNNINGNNINDNNINDNNINDKNIPKINIHNENIHGGNIHITMNYNIQNGENLALKMGNNNPDSKSDRELNIGKMVVYFNSTDQVIEKFPIDCHKDDKFKLVVKKLYEKYPLYRIKRVFFTANGNPMDNNKTLEENKIKDQDIIMLYAY
jgi:hypothetical protein